MAYRTLIVAGVMAEVLALALITEISASAGAQPHYPNCDAAYAAGVSDIRAGQPGYRIELDRDNDGIACERGGEGDYTVDDTPAPVPDVVAGGPVVTH